MIARLYNLHDPHYLAYLYDTFHQSGLSWKTFSTKNQEAYLENLAHPSRQRKKVTVSYDVSSFIYVLDHDQYHSLISDDNNPILLEINILLTHIYNKKTSQQIISLARDTGELRRTMFSSVLSTSNEKLKSIKSN